MEQSFIAGDPQPLPFAETHPAWCAGYGRAGNWLSIGASVIGSRHLRHYRARDDAFVLMGAGGYLIVAVADGVGGQMYSRIGAAHCANAVCREILGQMCVPHVRRIGIDDFDPATLRRELSALGIPRNTPILHPITAVAAPEVNWSASGTFRWNWQPYNRRFPTDLFEDEDLPPAPPSLRVALVRAFEATRASLAALAASLRLKLMHFTSTLLVVVTDVSSGASAAAQLGDGAILCVDTLQPVVLPPPRTDEDNPYTIALDDWRDGMVLTESAVPPSSGWLLVTDGALEFFPECGSACRTLLTQPADPAQQSVQLLQWLHGLSKTDWEDDRTVAAILTP